MFPFIVAMSIKEEERKIVGVPEKRESDISDKYSL